MSHEQRIPAYSSYDEYCIDLQSSILAELTELSFDFAGNKKGLKIIGARMAELEKQIAVLKARSKP